MKDKEAAEAALKGQGLGLAKAVRKSLEAKTDELRGEQGCVSSPMPYDAAAGFDRVRGRRAPRRPARPPRPRTRVRCDS